MLPCSCLLNSMWLVFAFYFGKKVLRFNVRLKADEISLVYHTRRGVLTRWLRPWFSWLTECGHVRRLALPVRRRLTMKLCLNRADADGRLSGSRVMHAPTKLRASGENLLGSFGIGFDSEPMQKIAVVGAMSALHNTTSSSVNWPTVLVLQI